MVPDLASIAAVAGAAARPVVLIDGQSGSGKTELARALAPILSAQLVRLDDLYQGWDGLNAASAAVASDILVEHRWQRWDWTLGIPVEWHELDAAAPLVVEGSGALTSATRMGATCAIWVELDETTRKARAIARDGVAYEPYWERWAAQERAHIARDRPERLADIIVAG